ncbi:M23 family metallopeptidase [Alphaproteobacteria bacterium]|nr:M23 family metallopeptidase [Alphaproteobacteria bacterium]
MKQQASFISIFLIYTLLFSIFVSCTPGPKIKNIEIGKYKFNKEKQSSHRSVRLLPGDTLLTISKKYQVTVKELVKYNKFKSPYVLKPGSFIRLPKEKYYKIRKKDTLFNIARCFSISTKDLYIKNPNLNIKRLKVGKSIKLPYYASINKCKIKDIKKRYSKKTHSSNYKPLFEWPLSGSLIATFGKQDAGRSNDGINIRAAKGNPVRAALKGKVIYSGNELPAWGNLILIKHANGWTTAYAHLDKILVKVGDIINTGNIIGSVGATGNVSKYQLHFQVRKNSKPVNPKNYLKKK